MTNQENSAMLNRCCQYGFYISLPDFWIHNSDTKRIFTDISYNATGTARTEMGMAETGQSDWYIVYK